MSKYFRWAKGRQETGYRKMALFMLMLKNVTFDGWLLFYPEGTFIPRHTDPVPGYRHYRINVILKQCKCGGNFWAKEPIIDWPRLKVFASDQEHSVSMMEQGTRYVLSIGVARRIK